MPRQRSLLHDPVDWNEVQNPNGPEALKNLPGFRAPSPPAEEVIVFPEKMLLRIWSGAVGQVLQDKDSLACAGLEVLASNGKRIRPDEHFFLNGYRWRYEPSRSFAPSQELCTRVHSVLPTLLQGVPAGHQGSVTRMVQISNPGDDFATVKGFHSWTPVTVELWHVGD